MDIQKIQQYKSAFDLIAKSIKDDEGNTIEVWYARELQQVLGYARWENFVVAIGRALESCKTLGINVDDHFREVTKMIALVMVMPMLYADMLVGGISAYSGLLIIFLLIGASFVANVLAGVIALSMIH
jgi:hypothetical protein